MSIAREHLYTLAPSLTLLFLASLLLLCWFFQRQQRFLLWQCCAYTLTALAFGIQSLSSFEVLHSYAPITGTLYLLGAWFLTICWTEHWKVSRQPRTSLLIAIATFIGIIYCSDNFWARVRFSGAGLGLIMLLPVMTAFRQRHSKDWLEQVLFVSAFVYALLTISRPILINVLGYTDFDQFPRSTYWLMTALSTLFFAIFFTILMVAIAIRTTIRQLRNERDQDSLTQILNRRAFYELAHCRLEDKRLYPMAILAGDIDHFKRINDTWGHSRGDQVLQLVSATLQRNLRNHDLVARFGGEEFVLLLTRINPAEAEQVAQRIRQELRSDHSVLPPNATLTMSFGIAPVENARHLEHALKEADDLLYAAKNAGRDQVHVAGIHYPDICFEHTMPNPEASASQM